MLRVWILERARQALVGAEDGKRGTMGIALDVLGAVTMLATAVAVF